MIKIVSKCITIVKNRAHNVTKRVKILQRKNTWKIVMFNMKNRHNYNNETWRWIWHRHIIRRQKQEGEWELKKKQNQYIDDYVSIDDWRRRKFLVIFLITENDKDNFVKYI